MAPLYLSELEKNEIITRNGGKFEEVVHGMLPSPRGDVPHSYTNRYSSGTVDEIFGFMGYSACETNKNRFDREMQAGYENSIDAGVYQMSEDAINGVRGMMLKRGKWQ